MERRTVVSCSISYLHPAKGVSRARRAPPFDEGSTAQSAAEIR